MVGHLALQKVLVVEGRPMLPRLFPALDAFVLTLEGTPYAQGGRRVEWVGSRVQGVGALSNGTFLVILQQHLEQTLVNQRGRCLAKLAGGFKLERIDLLTRRCFVDHCVVSRVAGLRT